MAQFTIDIPDELLPALVVEFGLVQGSTTATTPEEYFQASIVETVRQRAEIYKVGPYFTGPIDPQYNADGTPFGVVPVVDPTGLEGFDVVAGDPEPVVEEEV
jgi:hypothetical protein